MLQISKRSIILLAIANLLSALGGGSVLGKAKDIIQVDGRPVGSIIAFFIGTTFGLVLIGWIQKYLSERAPKWISLLGAICTALLIFVYSSYPTTELFVATLVLLILCFRFCFWFLARIYRANLASAQPKLLPLFEGSYVSGSILGLILFAYTFRGLSLIDILWIDFVTQMLSFFIDFTRLSQEKTSVSEKQTRSPSTKSLRPYILVFCLISIGTQVSLFQISKFSSAGVLLIVAFYIGMVLASIVSSIRDVRFYFSSRLTPLIEISKIGSISYVSILFTLALLFFLFFKVSSKESWVGLSFLVSVALSFIYELLALALAQKIAEEAKQISYKNAIAKTYAIMALTAAIAIGGFIAFDASLQEISVCSLICFFASYFVLRKQPLLTN